MNFHILTLFPEMVMQGLSASVIGRAAQKGLLSVAAVDIRDYTQDKHNKVDDYPYGGGAGMLMQAQPVYDAWNAVAKRIGRAPRTVYLTPQGTTFTQAKAKELAKEDELVLLCGHYEGIDERVLEEIVTDYVSIGDYVLTGGELPAMVLVDAVARMVPGVLGNDSSGAAESFEGNLLEYPQYSRPKEWHGKSVPEVLLSGNQKLIDAWRREEAIERTRQRRPDLYRSYQKLEECRQTLLRQKLHHIDMTELIARGQARLVCGEGGNVCLQDKESGIYFHTAEDEAAGNRLLEALREDAKEPFMLTLHQAFMVEPAQEILKAKLLMTCSQAVYTRKEKLPVTGLYRLDGKECQGQAQIRKLETCHIDTVMKYYKMVDDPDYMKERVGKGWMFGAFMDGELAGFAGMHTEGGIGMLFVLPGYRGKKIGKALETYMINLSLDRGYTPFGQVVEGNGISHRMQESLGLYFSKEPVYWLSQEQ